MTNIIPNEMPDAGKVSSTGPMRGGLLQMMRRTLVASMALCCAFALQGNATEKMSSRSIAGKNVLVKNEIADKLKKCRFVANKTFKREAKAYFCLFAMSTDKSSRVVLPRIAKIYGERLISDPDVELVLFPRERDEMAVKTWIKELNAKFPVVKWSSGNPLNLDLYAKGFPYIFIVKADGTIIKEGHADGLFNSDTIQEIKEVVGGTIELTGAEGTFDLSGPYGVRMEPAVGCENGAQYVLRKLKEAFLPEAVKYYGDPFQGKAPTRVFPVKIHRNSGGITRRAGTDSYHIGLAADSDKWDWQLELLASRILTVCHEEDDCVFESYVNEIVWRGVKGIDPFPEIKEDIRRGLEVGAANADRQKGRLGWLAKVAPTWSAFEELREKRPSFILDYCNLKNAHFAEGKLTDKITKQQMIELMSEVTGENVEEIFQRAGKQSDKSVKTRKIASAGSKKGNLFTLKGPFGLSIEADPGCENAAKNILKRLKAVYLPTGLRYLGDPFLGKTPSRVYLLKIERDIRSDRNERGWYSFSYGVNSFTLRLPEFREVSDFGVDCLTFNLLTICEEDDGGSFRSYVQTIIRSKAGGGSPFVEIKKNIRDGMSKGGKDVEKDEKRLRSLKEHAPMWSVFEELRKKHPLFMLDYSKLKNKRFAEGMLQDRISKDQMMGLLGEVTGVNVEELYQKYSKVQD